MKHIVHGDLFAHVDAEKMFKGKQYILHGCNAQGVMGSGFAKTLRENYPKAYNDYKQIQNAYGLFLGDDIMSEQPDGVAVHNMITQEFYGRDGRRYVDYGAVHEAIHMVVMHANADFSLGRGPIQLHYPKIGAGLGGGDWEIIDKIIDDVVSGRYEQFLYIN